MTHDAVKCPQGCLARVRVLRQRLFADGPALEPEALQALAVELSDAEAEFAAVALEAQREADARRANRKREQALALAATKQQLARESGTLEVARRHTRQRAGHVLGAMLARGSAKARHVVDLFRARRKL